MSSQSGLGNHLQADLDFHGMGLFSEGLSGFRLILILSVRGKAEGNVYTSGRTVGMSFSKWRVEMACEGISSPGCRGRDCAPVPWHGHEAGGSRRLQRWGCWQLAEMKLEHEAGKGESLDSPKHFEGGDLW